MLSSGSPGGEMDPLIGRWKMLGCQNFTLPKNTSWKKLRWKQKNHLNWKGKSSEPYLHFWVPYWCRGNFWKLHPKTSHPYRQDLPSVGKRSIHSLFGRETARSSAMSKTPNFPRAIKILWPRRMLRLIRQGITWMSNPLETHEFIAGLLKAWKRIDGPISKTRWAREPKNKPDTRKPIFKMHKFHSQTLFLPWSSGQWFCCCCLPSGETFGTEAAISWVFRQGTHVSKKKWCNWVHLSSWGVEIAVFRVAICRQGENFTEAQLINFEVRNSKGTKRDLLRNTCFFRKTFPRQFRTRKN